MECGHSKWWSFFKMKDFGHIATHGNYMIEGKMWDKNFNAINILTNDVVIPFSKKFIVPYEC